MSGVAAGIGAAVSIGIFLVKNSKAKKKERKAAIEKARIQRQITAFENNRQGIINPYAGVTSLAGLAADLSENLSNPFANLGVATSAAEIQMEQTDIALANTLDTLQATGASAGGATALAQAAQRSKKDVAASIEKQEADNEKLEAQGEQRLQEQQNAEKARIQGIQISEGSRAQNAVAQGAAFRFGAQENRDDAKLDRMAGGLDQSRQDAANASAAQNANTSALIGSLGNITAGAAAGMGGGSDSSTPATEE
tara:strand:- start:2 stop:760 length:759 start_codon:yes stop_codon:yes gene_type:complete